MNNDDDYSDTSAKLTKGNDEELAPAGFYKGSWEVIGSGAFYPCGKTRKKLPTGLYSIHKDDNGRVFVQKKELVLDSVIDLSSPVYNRVIREIETFWQSKALFSKLNVIYKRGVLLYGPPGGGKTVLLMLLVKKLIELDGIIFYCEHPEILSTLLQSFRQIEPQRPLIIIYEDIDEILNDRKGVQHALLSLLDGENQVENVVHLATTNYPELLAPRIKNRPSRFDVRCEVDYPDADTRYKYLKHITKNLEVKDEDIQLWVGKTDKLSIAHLRELIISVYCLGNSFDETLQRLREMRKNIYSKDELVDDKKFGF